MTKISIELRACYSAADAELSPFKTGPMPRRVAAYLVFSSDQITSRKQELQGSVLLKNHQQNKLKFPQNHQKELNKGIWGKTPI